MGRLIEAVHSYLRGKSVVVIDPALNYRNCIKRYLANMEIVNVVTAASTKELAKDVDLSAIGLFIVEWGLPEENGVQYCRRLRSDPRFAGSPFLMTAQDNTKTDVVLACEVGVDGFLVKPFEFEDFADAVSLAVYARVYPDTLNARLAEGDRMLAGNQLRQAESVYQEVLAEKPNSARAYCGLARVAMRQQAVTDAISFFEKAIAANPEYLEAYRLLADAHAKADNHQDLAATARKLNELSPGNPKYTLLMAQASLKNGDEREAEAFFRKTVQLSPRLADAYKGLGKLKLIQEDFDEAMRNFEKALDLDPGDILLLSDLASTYVRCGRVEQGIEKYEAAIRMDPRSSRLLCDLAKAKELSGNYGDAEYYYIQALARDPANPEAKQRLEVLKIRA